MNIIHGYRNDRQLRDSFNALAEATFDGLNFEGWYQNGFWGENYDPYSVVIDGEVVSNVSVNKTDFLVGGKRCHVLQLGTVMTAPEHRGKGYGRAIMEAIGPQMEAADGVYLFGNDGVVDYYPKFGFRPAREMEYAKNVEFRGECTARQVIMDNPGAWAKLSDAMERSTFREGCRMVGNPGLIFFYVSQFMQEAAYYIPGLDAWVIAEPEDGEITIHNIFAEGSVTIDDVARAFGNVQKIRLAFAPADSEGWEMAQLREEDCNFFVRGSFFDMFEEKNLRIPALSYA